MGTTFELEAVFSEPHERTPSVSGSFPDGGTPCEVSRESDATTPAESAANEISATNSNSRAYSSRLSDSAGEIVPSSPISPAPPVNLDRAYELFQQRRDTFEIARILGITEARAHKRITLERDRLNGTRTEFEGQLP